MRGHDLKPYAREQPWWVYALGIPAIALVFAGMLWCLWWILEFGLRVL